MTTPVLYDYWRSSASYRVRIALALKDIEYERIDIDLVTRANKSPEHLARNPQGLVPVLDIDGHRLTQSLAIIDYLEATRPEQRLIPADPLERARVMAAAYAIAMEIHPICNTSVAHRVSKLIGGGEETKREWIGHYIGKGLRALETILSNEPGPFCFGDTPTVADCCLVPQLYNARRWGVDLADMPRLVAIDAHCATLDAFRAAHPDTVGPQA
jgi:maleylacetoacetate isomerase